MHIINIDSLPDTAQLTIAELETSQAKGRRGITRLSSSQIRRLEAAGQFPQSRQNRHAQPLLCSRRSEEMAYRTGKLMKGEQEFSDQYAPARAIVTQDLIFKK